MQQPGSSDEADEKNTRPKVVVPSISISILLLVGLQTLVVALTVLMVPLLLSLRNSTDSNNLCVDTGREVSGSLAQTVQRDAAMIALERVVSLMASTEQILEDFNLAVQNSYVDPMDYNDLYNYFLMVQQRVNPTDSILFGYSNAEYLIVRGDNNLIGVVLLKNHTNCPICDLILSSPFVQKNKFKPNFQIRFPISDFRMWNSITLDAAAGSSFPVLQRPWYIQGSARSIANASVQWTAPYFNVNATFAAITANRGIWSKNGTFLGVFGINFTYKTLVPLVKKLLSSPSSFMFLMTHRGEMLVSSFPEDLGNSTAGTIKNLKECTTPTLVKIYEALNAALKANQTYESLGPIAMYDMDGIWIQVTVTPNYTPPLIIVNGASKKDYTGDYDTILDNLKDELSQSARNMVGSGVGIFLAMLVLGVTFTWYFISKPMQKLGVHLEMAKNFEFKKIMDGGGFGKASFIKELGVIHVSFFAMIENFAFAIKRNQSFQPSEKSSKQHRGSIIPGTNTTQQSLARSPSKKSNC